MQINETSPERLRSLQNTDSEISEHLCKYKQFKIYLKQFNLSKINNFFVKLFEILLKFKLKKILKPRFKRFY